MQHGDAVTLDRRHRHEMLHVQAMRNLEEDALAVTALACPRPNASPRRHIARPCRSAGVGILRVRRRCATRPTCVAKLALGQRLAETRFERGARAPAPSSLAATSGRRALGRAAFERTSRLTGVKRRELVMLAPAMRQHFRRGCRRARRRKSSRWGRKLDDQFGFFLEGEARLGLARAAARRLNSATSAPFRCSMKAASRRVSPSRR